MPSHDLIGSCSPAPWSRRRLLTAGGLGMFGLTMPRILRATETAGLDKLVARAKSVVFLFQWGGPSHVDMFDMKPDAPEGIRGFHKPIKSKADGIWVSERLPKTARIMDKIEPWWCGWANSAARRRSTRTSAAITGPSATPPCWPAAA